MSENGNGKFIRGLFWALVIGSFGWTTFVAFGIITNFSAHCSEAKAEATEIRKEMVARDEIINKEVRDGFTDIKSTLAELRTDIKYLRKSNVRSEK